MRFVLEMSIVNALNAGIEYFSSFFFRGAMEEINGVSSDVIPETTVFIIFNC